MTVLRDLKAVRSAESGTDMTDDDDDDAGGDLKAARPGVFIPRLPPGNL